MNASPPAWRTRVFWTRTGLALSAAWIGFVLWKTGSNPTHPWFNYIFIVPLVAWVVGLLAAEAVKRALPPE